jgi:hypothetical protein
VERQAAIHPRIWEQAAVRARIWEQAAIELSKCRYGLTTVRQAAGACESKISVFRPVTEYMKAKGTAAPKIEGRVIVACESGAVNP